MSDDMEDSAALVYLAGCAPTTQGIAEWFNAQFGREGAYKAHPLPYINFDWVSLSPFAQAHPPLKEALVRHLCREDAMFFGHETHDLVVELRDDRLRDSLIRAVRSKDDVDLIGTYWLLSPLLRAWGRDDPEVESLLREVAYWSIERLATITTLLPAVFPDIAACRDKLIAIGRVQRVRGGLARTMREIGVGADDEEAVETLLSRQDGEGTLWDEMPETIRHFGSHPRVREIATERRASRNPPLAEMAAAYEADPDMRGFLLRKATPLPSGLRQQIADAETIRSLAMADLRRGFDRECDPSVKVSLAAAHCVNLVAEDADVTDAVGQLEAMATAIGPDMHDRRAAAFTGLLILRRLERFAERPEDGKPLRVSLRPSLRQAPRVLAELTDRWEDAVHALGASLVARLGEFERQPDAVWEALAPYLFPDGPAAAAFLDYISGTSGALGAESLSALSRLMPGSATLHLHCWRTLRSHGLALLNELAGMRAAYLLCDQFPRTSADAKAAADLASASPRRSSAVAWCLLDPDAACARAARHAPIEYGRRRAWTVALHLGSVMSSPEDFVDLLRAAVTRPVLTVWDMQGVSNKAIARRLTADGEAVRSVMRQNRETEEPSERASLPRLLAAAGRADKELIGICKTRLSAPADGPFATAGYDCIADEVRPVSHALCDVIYSPHGL